MNTNTASLPQTAAPFARRAFLKGALAAGALPFLPSGAPAQSAAPAGKRKNTAPKYTGQKIRVAYIGIGNQGRADITQFEATGITEVVALCDTELGHHRTVSSLAKFPKAKLYRDFRRCLEENAPALDAVLVATPDFSHFPAVIYALSLGLHVYVRRTRE